MIEEMIGAFKSYGGRLVGILYGSPVLSTISFGAVLLILTIVGSAITNDVIHVPVFYPDVPVTSGS